MRDEKPYKEEKKHFKGKREITKPKKFREVLDDEETKRELEEFFGGESESDQFDIFSGEEPE